MDITKFVPTQWYVPSQISVNQNDTVTWINKDTEVHTITSGVGAGLESLMNKKQGTIVKLLWLQENALFA